jgi:hypothetical protein
MADEPLVSVPELGGITLSAVQDGPAERPSIS